MVVQSKSQNKEGWHTMPFAALLPLHSPDFNVFHNMRCDLTIQVKEMPLEKESYKNYAARVIKTIKNVTVDLINRIIDSLPKRMNMVVIYYVDQVLQR